MGRYGEVDVRAVLISRKPPSMRTHHAPPPATDRSWTSSTMATRSLSIACVVVFCLFATAVVAFSAQSPETTRSGAASNDRRDVLRGVAGTMGAVLLSSNPQLASAALAKSRTDGYAVRRSEKEWAYVLSGQQYNILREGGTERPYSSILEGEDRPGTFVCAGCGTPLFESAEKFHSGTGWPSFAAALDGVEVEDVNPVQMSLAGAELRCHSCGGHLGDVFLDGKLFVGTPAFKSGKRFCIDGAALIFKPADGSTEVYGDTAPPTKPASLPSFLEPPKINAR